MSQENVETMRRGYSAWGEGGVDAIIPFLDSEVRWSQDPSFPGAKTYVGHRGVREWDAWLGESFEERHVEVERLIDCGDGVLALVVVHTRGRGSGAEAQTPMAHLWRLRDGKGILVKFYLDRDEALEAAGLAE